MSATEYHSDADYKLRRVGVVVVVIVVVVVVIIVVFGVVSGVNSTGDTEGDVNLRISFNSSSSTSLMIALFKLDPAGGSLAACLKRCQLSA